MEYLLGHSDGIVSQLIDCYSLGRVASQRGVTMDGDIAERRRGDGCCFLVTWACFKWSLQVYALY